MNNLKKNLIFLGIFVIFLGLSQTANAAYCEPYYNGSTNCYTNNYSNNISTGSRIVSDGGGMYYRETNYANINSTQYNANSNYGSPIASTYGTQYGGTYYDNTGSPYNGPVNTTNTTNGANTNTTTNKNTTTTKTTTNNKTATNTTTRANDTNTTTTNVSNERVNSDQASGLSANSLSALSLQGSNTFMPDTVWEWICVFFLLLIIIILIRQFRKQGSHEVHTVAHH
ncbi:hypothetical protein IT400_02825 [Candidatus Nomurabacteria bacterium]|nr:hypothetical protein [Candidatus Nomurabacteria bacterium]